MDNQVLYKVYDENDVFIGLINDVITDIYIPNELNNIGSPIQLSLARNADTLQPELAPILDDDNDEILDASGRMIMSLLNLRNKIGPDSVLQHNNKVEIVISAAGNLAILDSDDDEILDSGGNEIIGVAQGDGEVLYQGFIADIDINYGGSENTSILLTPYSFDLDQYVVEDSGDTTVAFNSYDPSDIIKDLLDVFPSVTTYDTGTISDTGTTVSYTFNTNTYKEALDKCLELAPSDWFYYIDPATNFVYFRERPSTPDHYFYLGKHIENLDLKSSILSVVNDVLFSGGEVSGENLFVRRTESVAANTRRGLKRFSDNRVTLQTSAEIIADGEIERNNQVLYTTKITVLAATYPISTINLGDMVSFRNFDSFVDSLELQVIRMNRGIDRIELELGTLLPRVNKRIEDIKRNLILQETENNPTSPS